MSEEAGLPLRETVAARLRHARVQSKLSLQQLADKAGCSKAHVWGIENGCTNPTAALVGRLAVALEVDPAWLAGWNRNDIANLLQAVREAIASLDEGALGYSTQGNTAGSGQGWPLRDELLHNIDAVLQNGGAK